MGRPKLQIDPERVLRLARWHCPYTEIAADVGCSVDTLERRFADLIAKGREQGKRSLRRMQWKAARAGNVVMLIWLGKQYLNQTEKVEQVGAVTVQVEWDTETPATQPHDHGQVAAPARDAGTGAP